MTRTTLLIPALLIPAMFALSACETTKGAGRDLQKAGQAISNAASDVQEAL